MPEPRDAAFTSSRADAEFNARFHEPVKQMLTELTTDSGPVYERIGKCWSEVEGVLEALNESEAHKPSEGATLAGDLQDAVISALAFLFEGKPQVKREDGSTFTLRYQFGSIEKAYKTARAQRQAAQAANRAAAAAHFSPPGIPPMQASIGTPARVGGAQVESDDVIELMMARMNAAPLLAWPEWASRPCCVSFLCCRDGGRRGDEEENDGEGSRCPHQAEH